MAVQALAYIQRELAHYAATHLDCRVSEFCLDQDIHPVFKVVSPETLPRPPPWCLSALVLSF